MIHVCFGLHDGDGRYSKFTGTAISSMFVNTSAEVTVHILHDNTLTQDNRDKFVYLAKRYGQLVKFYNIEELCADKIAQMVRLVPQVKTARVSIGTFFRLLIPQLLPTDIDKCLYVDSDMLVNLDIAELWRIDVGDKPLAAVRETDANAYNYENIDSADKYVLTAGFVKYEDYFNAGLLLMNLRYLRNDENVLMNGVKWYNEHPQCNAFDQDIFNYLFSKDYVMLPAKFDRFVCNERSQGKTQIQSAIYHYTGNTLQLDTSDPFNRLWMEYFIQTPWFDADTFGRLCTGIQHLHVDWKKFMIQISTIMSGKTRAFVILPSNLEATLQIFSVRPDEEIILFESLDSLPKLIDVINRECDKKLFFVMLPDLPLKIFTDAGIVYGRDFLSGFEFLSEVNAMPLDSYRLLKTL